MKRIVVIVLFALVAGCSGMRGAVPDDDLRATKRVGVASTLGDSVDGIYRGVTVFNNAGFVAPVPDWHIDKFATDAALSLLASNPRFSTAELILPPAYAKLTPAEKDEVLWNAARQQGFDRIVLLYPSVSDNFAMYHPGYGLYEMSLLGLPRYCIYAAYVVGVYDVATRKRLAWEWGGQSPCILSNDGTPFKPKFDDYTDAEKALMRRKVEARMSETLPYALDGLALKSKPVPSK